MLILLQTALGAQPGPLGISSAETQTAGEMLVLREKISKILGRPKACAKCAIGLPPPPGQFPGGKCCSHPTEKLFTEVALASLRATGVTSFGFSGSEFSNTGCVFRTSFGCKLTPRYRPSACIGYICDELASELREKGILGTIEHLCGKLAEAEARFGAARAIRNLALDLEDLI